MYFKIDSTNMFFDEKNVSNLQIASKGVKINQVYTGTTVNFVFNGVQFTGKLIKKHSLIDKFVNKEMFLQDEQNNKTYQVRYGCVHHLGKKGYYVFDLQSNGKGYVSPQKSISDVPFTHIYMYKASGSALCELIFIK